MTLILANARQSLRSRVTAVEELALFQSEPAGERARGLLNSLSSHGEIIFTDASQGPDLDSRAVL